MRKIRLWHRQSRIIKRGDGVILEDNRFRCSREQYDVYWLLGFLVLVVTIVILFSFAK